jgi:acetyl esterase
LKLTRRGGIVDQDAAEHITPQRAGSVFPPGVLEDARVAEDYLIDLREYSAPSSFSSPSVHRVSELRLDGGVLARVYEPRADIPSAVLIYLHGGGWVSGDLEAGDASCRFLSAQANMVVVNVAYRLAPESPFPAALDDGFAAMLWASHHAEEIGGRSDQLVVAGSSAGGNLAAAICLRARDQSGPVVSLQVLICPVLDSTMNTRSYLEFADGDPLSRAQMAWFWQQYVPDASSRTDPLASPHHASSLSGLPPALIVTAECDPLRDEAELYAERLQAAGVEAHVRRYPGEVHGFAASLGMRVAAESAHEWIVDGLRKQFDTRRS